MKQQPHPRKLCIAYHMPYPGTIYAYRTIYTGFKAAFEDKGHVFIPCTPDDDLKEFLDKYNPDIFMTFSHFFYRKFLDYKVLKKHRDRGMLLLTKIDFWQSPLSKGRINEAPSMKDDAAAKKLIKQGLLGDVYYSTASQGDGRMAGFEEFAGQPFVTIPLAADSISLRPVYDEKFASDIAFLGTNLPQKREFFKEWLYPLKKEYDLRLYGQDWTAYDRWLGKATKLGQYFNIPVLKTLQKPKVQIEEEAKMYASSKILVNLHEDYQRQYGGDCNERTFRVPFCGGFEISDDVAVIRDYLKDGKEIVIAKDKADWFDKIRYYYDHPKEAEKIAKAGQKRVRKDHTYHNRVDQIIGLLS